MVSSLLAAGGVVCTALAAVVVFYLVYIPLRMVSFYRGQGIRGPPWRFLFGDSGMMRRLPRLYTEPFIEMWRAIEHDFGKVSYLFLGPFIRLRVRDAGLVQEILVSHSYSFPKPALLRDSIGAVLGEHSVLLAEGDEHRHHRRIVGAAFTFSALVSLVPVMAESATEAVTEWLRGAAPTTLAAEAGDTEGASRVELEVHELLSALTLNIIGRAAFASADVAGGVAATVAAATSTSSASGGSPEQSSFYALVASVLRSSFDNSSVIPLWRFVPTPGNVRFWRQARVFRRIGLELVAKRREERRVVAAATVAPASVKTFSGGTESHRAAPAVKQTPQQSTGPSDGKATLLDLLLDAQEDGGSDSGRPSAARLSDAAVLDNSITFLFAGHETTTQAVTFAMYLIAKPENLHWQEEARQQVWRACRRPGTPEARAPTHADLAAMPLVNCIVLETMRLYPPVPVVMRVTARDVVLQPARGQPGPPAQGDDWSDRALQVRAGTILSIPIATLHRDERYWGSDPDAFNPLRFALSAESRFALLEAKVILAVLLQRLDWRLSPTYVHKPTMIVTLRPSTGLQLLVRPAAMAS